VEILQCGPKTGSRNNKIKLPDDDLYPERNARCLNFTATLTGLTLQRFKESLFLELSVLQRDTGAFAVLCLDLHLDEPIDGTA
jgi:hypothetical protein